MKKSDKNVVRIKLNGEPVSGGNKDKFATKVVIQDVLKTAKKGDIVEIKIII